MELSARACAVDRLSMGGPRSRPNGLPLRPATGSMVFPHVEHVYVGAEAEKETAVDSTVPHGMRP